MVEIYPMGNATQKCHIQYEEGKKTKSRSRLKKQRGEERGGRGKGSRRKAHCRDPMLERTFTIILSSWCNDAFVGDNLG